MEKPVKKSVYDQLNKRHQKFVDAIVQGVVQWKAYRDNVYDGDGREPKYSTLSTNASRLISNNADIRRAIAERSKLFKMSRGEAIKRVGDLARATPEHFLKVGLDGKLEIDLSTEEAQAHLYLIKELEEKRRVLLGPEESEDEAVRVLEITTKIKLHDAGSNLDRILRAFGAYNHTQRTAVIDMSDFSDDELRRVMAGEDPALVILDRS